MLKYLAGVAAALLALWPSAVLAAPGWQPYLPVPGVFDIAGPRSDDSLVVAGSGALYTLTPDGVLSRFAPAYHDDAGSEAYLVVTPLVQAGEDGCTFARDDTFILRLHKPVGVTRVAADGTVSDFADVDVPSLNGIAFESALANRLLVTGPVNGKTEVAEIDCKGNVRVLTRSAPTVEGGMAVAPLGFGNFGGDLVAPDELSGVIWAIGGDGSSRKVVDSGLPHGQDTGVEGAAFVPPGFIHGGYVYFSDRKTSNNPHPGSDHVLRLSSADLAAAGVQVGDLLAATEGGASMIDVRCGVSCGITKVLPLPTSAHGEGHIVFTPTLYSQPPVATAVQTAYAPAGSGGCPFGALIAIAAAVLAATAGVLAVVSRRRR